MQYNSEKQNIQQPGFQAELTNPMPNALYAAQQGHQYYGGPIGQQAVVGQPYVAPQAYNQQQLYYQQQHPQQVQYQQVVFVPASQGETGERLVQAEMEFQSYRRWFTGCNCCVSIILIIILITRCVASFRGDLSPGAGVLYIIQIILWFAALYASYLSIRKRVVTYFKQFNILLGLSLGAEIIGDIISFATHNDDYRIASIIITLIIDILLYLLYFRRGYRMKCCIEAVNQERDRQNAQRQQ